MKRLSLFIATAGNVGYIPMAPGTAGSLVGLILLTGVRHWAEPMAEVWVLFGVVIAGVSCSSVAEVHIGREDPKCVVIDEVAGMLATMLWVPLNWSTVVVGFVAFRFFDITKPFPAHNVESLHGGLGIMADDLVAAVYAAASVRLFLWASSALVAA
jgi:phosphatidylglycerophosphatase A